MSKTEELEAKLAERRAARAAAEAAQYETDLEARLALEDEHGEVAAVKVPRFVAGHPTRAFVRAPSTLEYERYKARVYKAIDKKSVDQQRDAGEQLARACWVYPATDEARKSMLDAFPGMLSSIQIAATALAEGKAEDEGKG